jgi:uncharacterized protein
MPQPWSKPLEVDRLSRGAAALEFDVELTQLPRLRSRVELIGGSVHGTVRFARKSGRAVADVTLEGTARLTCQRCMQPMSLPLSAHVPVAVLSSAEEASALEDAFEPVLAPEGRISVGELIEEEVLLSLPIVPMHVEGGQCPSSEAHIAADDAPADAVTQRPFARLGELLNQK